MAEIFSTQTSNRRRLQANDFIQAISDREQQLYERERDAETDRMRANDSYIKDLEERYQQELDRLKKEGDEREEKAGQGIW